MANFKIKDKLNLSNPADGDAFLIDIGVGYRHVTLAQLRAVIQSVLEGRVATAENAISVLKAGKSDTDHIHANASSTVNGFMSSSHFVKLENIVDYFKGYYADATALNTAYPAGQSGWYAYVGTTSKTIYVWDATIATPAWVDTGLASAGDMLASIYDPQGKGADAFNRANHTGTQAISTILGLQAALDARVQSVSVNGGTPSTPDAAGNVNLIVTATTGNESARSELQFITGRQIDLTASTDYSFFYLLENTNFTFGNFRLGVIQLNLHGSFTATFSGTGVSVVGTDPGPGPNGSRRVFINCENTINGDQSVYIKWEGAEDIGTGEYAGTPDFALNTSYVKGNTFAYQYRIWRVETAFTSGATTPEAELNTALTAKNVSAIAQKNDRSAQTIDGGANATSSATVKSIESEVFFIDSLHAAANHTLNVSMSLPVKFSPLFISVRKQSANTTIAWDAAVFEEAPNDTGTTTETVEYMFWVNGLGKAVFQYKGGYVAGYTPGTDAENIDYTQAADVTVLNGSYTGKLNTFLNRLYTYVMGAFNKRVTGIAFSGTTTKTLTVTREDGSTLTANFTDMVGETGSGEVNTSSNAGTTGAGLALPKAGANLPFKRIAAGTNVSITENADHIVINASGNSGRLRADSYTPLTLSSTVTWDVNNTAEGKSSITIPSGSAVSSFTVGLSNYINTVSGTDRGGFTGILAVYNDNTVTHTLNFPTGSIYAVVDGENHPFALSPGSVTEFNIAYDGRRIKITKGAFNTI